MIDSTMKQYRLLTTRLQVEGKRRHARVSGGGGGGDGGGGDGSGNVGGGEGGGLGGGGDGCEGGILGGPRLVKAGKQKPRYPLSMLVS